ncbi:hypothetical protein [Cypionkella sinensis]|uniref:Uncharacterized protein n=1 Tax=Cypionkella sinensis TaxID=1756043 RepID=A0ABV7IWZ6_9RHOB
MAFSHDLSLPIWQGLVAAMLAGLPNATRIAKAKRIGDSSYHKKSLDLKASGLKHIGRESDEGKS